MNHDGAKILVISALSVWLDMYVRLHICSDWPRTLSRRFGLARVDLSQVLAAGESEGIFLTLPFLNRMVWIFFVLVRWEFMF